jgi:hypothetical protein
LLRNHNGPTDTSAFIFFQNGLRANPDEGAMGCSNKRTEPTGELYLKKVKDKWGLVRVTYIVALSNRMLMDVMIDLERMQPFEEKCNGRLSLLASKVLADSRGIVWMYGEFAMLSKKMYWLCLSLKGELPFLQLYLMEVHAHMLIIRFQHRTNAL